MYKMCQEKEVFRNYFTFGSPKFVSPCPPPPDAIIKDYSKDPTDHQTNVSFEIVSFFVYYLRSIFIRYLWMKLSNKCNCQQYDHT